MGREGIWNVEFLDHNTERRYPLSAQASGEDVTGEFQLPNDFLVGLYLPINAAMNVKPAAFTLKNLTVYGSGYVLTIGYQTDDEVLPVASASFSRVGHVPYSAYPLRGLGDFFDTFGQIIIGKLDNINLQPAGRWEFEEAGGNLEVDCIRPQLRGVSQLRVQNGETLSEPILGDVILRAGANMRITPIIAPDEDPILQFDAIEGEGLNEICVCEGGVTIAPPIRTINKIPPTPDGNFTLTGSDCLALEEIANGIRINDSCSKPCCGCAELEVVTAQLEQFGRSATTLENFLAGLEARVSQMDQVVLGSKLGDRGCKQCD